jgi:hypothetical protein
VERCRVGWGLCSLYFGHPCGLLGYLHVQLPSSAAHVLSTGGTFQAISSSPVRARHRRAAKWTILGQEGLVERCRAQGRCYCTLGIVVACWAIVTCNWHIQFHPW